MRTTRLLITAAAPLAVATTLLGTALVGTTATAQAAPDSTTQGDTAVNTTDATDATDATDPGQVDAASKTPIDTSKTPIDTSTTPINVEQTPNVGVALGGFPVPFIAALTAEAIDSESSAASDAVTRVALSPAADACGSSLRSTKVGVTLTNRRTGKVTDATFPACIGSKPNRGVDVVTGSGQIEFTTSIVGQANRTFSLVPGTGKFTR